MNRQTLVPAPTAGACIRHAAVSLLCLAIAAGADTLNMGTKSHEGTFEGFENGKFLFRTSEGREVKEPRTSVQKLTLTEPRKVSLVRNTKADPVAMTLTGYESGKFAVKEGGKDATIPGMQVKAVTVEMEMMAGGGGGAVDDPPRPVPAVDISGLADREDLTPAQKGTLERYKAAREKYDAFLAESSALVTQMDKATGPKREELLNVLRRRKVEEQPVKRDLEAGRAALLTAFPELAGGGKAAAQGKWTPPPENGPAAGAGTIVLKVPKTGENEVFLIDTAILQKGKKLSDAQTEAIRAYDGVRADYEKLAADPMGADAAAVEAIQEALAEAQAAILKAFPNLKLVPE